MMTRGKRLLDSNTDGEENRPEIKKQKSHVLACVILEALKRDSSSMEPFFRSIVREGVESALAKFGPAMVVERLPPKQIQGSNGRKLCLRFIQSKLPDEIFTGTEVAGEGGAEIRVVLIDMSTGDVVRSGPESCARLLLVVLKGDFNIEDDGDWPWEEFERHVMKEREGKRPLLIGDLKVSLREGVGSLGKFTFTDNSRWTTSGKFRLGVKVESGFCEGIHVGGAKTNAFFVKEQRGKSYKKRYPPSWNDEVWRLEGIRKDGSYQKRLNGDGISTVENFLRLLVRDPERLRKILGRMSDKKWHIIVKHAKTCSLNPRINYVYYYDNNTKNNCIVFNSIYEFSGLIVGGQSYTTETLPASEKVFVDALVKKAYDNWEQTVEYEGRMLLNLNQNETASSFQAGQQVSVYPPSFVLSEQASMNSGLVIRDDPLYSEEQVFAPHQPSSVPLVPANSEPAVGGDMGLEEEFCLEDYLCPPPCKYVTLRLMLFCVVRFKRAVAGRLVELRD